MGENLAEHSVGSSTHPYYRRSKPTPHDIIDFASDTTHIDFTHAHTPAYPPEPVDLSAFTSLFDARAAAAVSDAVGFLTHRDRQDKIRRTIRVFPSDPPAGKHLEDVLLEYKSFWFDSDEQAPPVLIPKGKCLAALAYPDYFPELDAHPELTVDGISAGEKLRRMVSQAILAANPGWCGTFGPGVDGLFDFTGDSDPLEGNYDMSQMHLLQIAYRYFDELSPEAREWLIIVGWKRCRPPHPL